MSHTAFFARGSTSGGGHMPLQMPPPQDGGEYLMPPATAYPYAAPAAASGYVTSSGHMVSTRAPLYVELPSRSSPFYHQHHNERQQDYHHQHHQQQYHHHQHGRQGYPAAGSSLLNGYRWEECFKMDGKKFWRHKETGVIIHKDPYR